MCWDAGIRIWWRTRRTRSMRRQLLPTYMAERTAEFKLFLAYRADRAGMQPADLAGAAEQLARKAFRVSAMNDDHDWRALLRAFGSISNEDLRNAMEP